MAATVLIYRWTGSAASPTYTDITSINTVANAVDLHQTVAANSLYPVRAPTSGTNHSYWVVTRLYAQTSPAGTINNIRWNTDGSNNFGTGIACNGNSAAIYVQATGTLGVSGTVLNPTNYSTLDGPPADVFLFDPISPFNIAGSLSSPNTGHFGDFFVYQMSVDPTASPGPTNQETFTWSYDET